MDRKVSLMLAGAFRYRDLWLFGCQQPRLSAAEWQNPPPLLSGGVLIILNRCLRGFCEYFISAMTGRSVPETVIVLYLYFAVVLNGILNELADLVRHIALRADRI